MGRGNFKGERRQLVIKYSDTLPCAVQKRLNDRDTVLNLDSGESMEAFITTLIRILSLFESRESSMHFGENN